MLTDSGFIIFKYYLDISKEEQKDRFDERKKNPLKQWKISPIVLVFIRQRHNT
ncbi:polyphosphate kinase 2 (PPK2 family) [Pedobacter sp. UYP24]